MTDSIKEINLVAEEINDLTYIDNIQERIKIISFCLSTSYNLQKKIDVSIEVNS